MDICLGHIKYQSRYRLRMVTKIWDPGNIILETAHSEGRLQYFLCPRQISVALLVWLRTVIISTEGCKQTLGLGGLYVTSDTSVDSHTIAMLDRTFIAVIGSGRPHQLFQYMVG